MSASSELRQLFEWQRRFFKPNWSIATGNEYGIIGLDFDGADAEADLLRLSAEYGPPPPTIKVTSGGTGGRFHLWYQCEDQSEELRTTTKVLETCLDVRGWHGQLVGPGSLHKSGARYQFAPGCAPGEVELARLPSAWFDALPKRVEHAKKARNNAPRGKSRVRIEHFKSIVLGDGENRGGFHGPIYTLAVRFIRNAGVDVDRSVLLGILKELVLKAPVSPQRDPADLVRYTSDDYLLEQIENARTWCAREQVI